MIVDLIAGFVAVFGALLMALGAAGLLRYPDVFTRMHAATKAATVGVIAIVAAAAFEAGALGGALTLGLVVALLFLSAPLGMSLLARAAYHDPETPRSPRTRELATSLPIAESTSTRRVPGTSRWLAVWLWLVWIALFGSLSVGVVVGGALVAGAVALSLRVLAPRWPHALLRPWRAVHFVVYFAGRMAISTWQAVAALFRPVDQLRPAVVEIPLRSRTRNELMLLMNAISFTPGTVALEVHDRLLYVHVLDTDDPADTAAEIEAMEDRIIEMFGGEAAVGASLANDD